MTDDTNDTGEMPRAVSLGDEDSIDVDDVPLFDHLPAELFEADEVDWGALCRQIGTHSGVYEFPKTPDGEPGPWLDRFGIMQDAAMHARDGGEIDVDRVIQS